MRWLKKNKDNKYQSRISRQKICSKRQQNNQETNRIIIFYNIEEKWMTRNYINKKAREVENTSERRKFILFGYVTKPSFHLE